MGIPVHATPRARPAYSRRGLGAFLVVTGALLAVPSLILVILLPQPYQQIAGFVAGLGLVLVVSGPLLIFTRWQFARNVGICPACGAQVRQGNGFCTQCDNRLW
jgi:hypothetical protein